MHLSETGLNLSAQNVLYANEIFFVEDLEWKNLFGMRGLGPVRLSLVHQALASVGMMLSRTNGGALVNINEQHDDTKGRSDGEA